MNMRKLTLMVLLVSGLAVSACGGGKGGYFTAEAPAVPVEKPIAE